MEIPEYPTTIIRTRTKETFIIADKELHILPIIEFRACKNMVTRLILTKK
jgi:hypothetical protein